MHPYFATLTAALNRSMAPDACVAPYPQGVGHLGGRASESHSHGRQPGSAAPFVFKSIHNGSIMQEAREDHAA
jgi:hypothetical protein